MRTTEPTIITTRETVEWTRSWSDYPATLWTLAYYFRGPGVGFNAAGVASGTSFVITVPGTTTDDVTLAGRYTWQAWLTKISDATKKIEIETGTVIIKLGFDPASMASVETRSPAKIMLDTIDAALLQTGDMLKYEISTPAGSRMVQRSTRAEVLALRKYWAGIYARELAQDRVRNGGQFGQTILGRIHDV